MSDQDRFDWSNDTDFESLADEPIEGFADFEDAEGYHDLADDFPGDAPTNKAQTGTPAAADGAANRSAAAVAPSKKTVRKTPRPTRSNGVAGVGLGLLVAASILVAGAGIGAVALLAAGVSPVALWRPEALQTWQNYLDPVGHPLNLLALVCLGVVFLTLLGCTAIARSTGTSRRRLRESEALLSRLTSLRLENETAWQDPVFKDHENASTFVAETLGAWRLQAARQRHYTGLDGELRRLQKALADGSRQDLTGRFDTPAVGALADEIVRCHDERDSLLRENSSLRTGHESSAAELITVLQGARQWQDASARNLGAQGTATERLSERLNDWVAALAVCLESDEAKAACAAFKTELTGICDSESNGPDTTAELTALVDRGSKLAFQIAMEVARLGPRGERLVPMSQSLEDLTTEFRQVADQMRNQHGPGRSLAARLHKLSSRFADVELQVAGVALGDSMAQMRELAPAAAQLARNLRELAHSHGPQTDRLYQLGNGLASSFGAEFDADLTAATDAEDLPAGVIDLSGQTPFAEADTAGGKSIHHPAEVDPFSVKPPRRAADTPGDPSFTSSVAEPAVDIFGSGLDRAKLPALEIESSFTERANPFGNGWDDEPDQALSAPSEKVYDLEDFGAESAGLPDDVEPADDPECAVPEETVHDLSDFGAVLAADADGESVYELSDLGAVPLQSVEPESDCEPVLDLADLGAVRLEHPVAQVDGEVFELAAFGAVRLDADADDDLEPVYDLDAFGAVPLT